MGISHREHPRQQASEHHAAVHHATLSRQTPAQPKVCGRDSNPNVASLMAGSSFATELDYIRGLVNSSSPQCTRFFSKAFSLFKTCLKRRLMYQMILRSRHFSIWDRSWLPQPMYVPRELSHTVLYLPRSTPEMRHLTLRSKDSGDLS